ncbi:MAG: dihydroorotase [Bacteroidales bacterium]|nr:dihydroorotase [Bacteroidales bacterium]MCF8456692.1 dihydroorotase [Bacteroidales bacterium]
MNKSIFITGGRIVNEGRIVEANLLIEGDWIKEIFLGKAKRDVPENSIHIDATGKFILPGVIDDQVHFREPGLTHKGDLYTESKAAVAGGITTFFEMPNTSPQATTLELLEDKYELASQKSLANYSFYLGATNNNIEEIIKADPSKICGLKIFMGSSTGNMLVDNIGSLRKIFSQSPLLIATHCEDESTIKQNFALFREKYGEEVPIICHPDIRSEEACYLSSSLAVSLAKEYGSRLHVLHLSTEKELSLFSNQLPSKEKKITAEVCVHHLWFSKDDYENHGAKIKWNPAIKNESDRAALFAAMLDNTIDVIATDHAPHTVDEKSGNYFKAASGGPLVQHSLKAMLEFYHQKKITLEKVVEKMCHTPAEIFKVEKRGYIREGYFADLCIVDLEKSHQVSQENILYKCGWSPFEGQVFQSEIAATIVNGHLAFLNGKFDESKKGRRVSFANTK